MPDTRTLTQSDVESLRAAAAAAWSKSPAGAGQVAFDWKGGRYRARFTGPDMLVLQPNGEVLVTIHGASRSTLASIGSQEPLDRVVMRAAVDQAVAELENHQPKGREFAESATSRLEDLTGQQQLHAKRLRLLGTVQLCVATTGAALALLGLWAGRPGGDVVASLLCLAGGAILIMAAFVAAPKAARCVAWRGRQQHGELEDEAFSLTYPCLITAAQRDTLAHILAEEPLLRVYLDRWLEQAGSITAGDLALIERAVVPIRALKRYDLARRQTRMVMDRLKASSSHH